MTHSFKSYAQNFEDVILYRALGSIRNGFYIDVGAQHPEIDSVSKAFYDLGWRGVHVEPVPYYAELLRKHRTGDLVIEAALSSFTGEIAMTVFPLTGLSTVVERVAEEHLLAGNQAALKQVIVPTQTLAMVADEVGCQDVHWLKIDVEGHEREVLEGWDSSTLRPWICVIEAAHPNSEQSTHLDWEHILIRANYLLVYEDGLNRFYTAKERLDDLKLAFSAPPNIHDRVQLGKYSPMCRDLVNDHHEELASRVAGYEAEVAELLDGRLQLMEQLTNTVDANVSLTRRLDAITSSVSWRITAPLRAAVAWIQQFVRAVMARANHRRASPGNLDIRPGISPSCRAWLARLNQVFREEDA